MARAIGTIMRQRDHKYGTVVDSRGLFGAATGIGYCVVAVGTTVVTTLMASWFRWTENALSDLGASGEPTAPLFNGGLILGGLVGILFAVWLLGDSSSRLQRMGSLLFGVAMGFRTLIGVFPIGEPLHNTVAIAFFVVVALALFVYGAGAYVAGQRLNAAVVLAAATLNPLVWTMWVAFGQSVAPGLAIPELLSNLGLLGWLLFTAARAIGITDPTNSPVQT